MIQVSKFAQKQLTNVTRVGKRNSGTATDIYIGMCLQCNIMKYNRRVKYKNI